MVSFDSNLKNGYREASRSIEKNRTTTEKTIVMEQYKPGIKAIYSVQIYVLMKVRSKYYTQMQLKAAKYESTTKQSTEEVHLHV